MYVFLVYVLRSTPNRTPLGIDAHLFELDPHHYYQGKGGLLNIRPP